ncbi:MAG: DUF2202 domain-containing protein [Actinomycetia bacterium]|nr:DUF2202 domain-containing protein [Actinomycetes bacterium]
MAAPSPHAYRLPGDFTDRAPQKLYNELFGRVLAGRSEAISVGVLIEETDIADLTNAARLDPAPQASRLLQNLITASSNHLRAFRSLA